MIFIGLFIRYIALILLLIISPAAYLALAFPGMQGMAKNWWAAFLKYVLYGPIMLFVLILIVVAGNISVIDIGESEANFAESAIKVVMLLGLSIAAAVAGSKLGAVGAGATVKFMKGMPSQALRHPKTTAAILGGAATGGAGWLAAGAGAVGGALAAKGTGMAAQRGWQAATRPYRTWAKGWEETAKKAEAAREKKSWGRSAYQALYGETKAEAKEADDQVRDELRAKGSGSRATPATAGTIDLRAVRNERAVTRLNDGEANTLMANVMSSGNKSVITSALGNVELAGKLNDATINNIYATGNTRYIDRFEKALEKYKDRYGPAKK